MSYEEFLEQQGMRSITSAEFERIISSGTLANAFARASLFFGFGGGFILDGYKLIYERGFSFEGGKDITCYDLCYRCKNWLYELVRAEFILDFFQSKQSVLSAACSTPYLELYAVQNNSLLIHAIDCCIRPLEIGHQLAKKLGIPSVLLSECGYSCTRQELKDARIVFLGQDVYAHTLRTFECLPLRERFDGIVLCEGTSFGNLTGKPYCERVLASLYELLQPGGEILVISEKELYMETMLEQAEAYEKVRDIFPLAFLDSCGKEAKTYSFTLRRPE